MQKYETYHSELRPDPPDSAIKDDMRTDVYLASEVDARIVDATNRIGRQEARLMYLERRLFECESAMLMGHDAGKAKYMNEYPEPMEAPSPY